jgi:hypothetical protein
MKNKKFLSKRAALELCRDLWQWLSENPGSTKSMAPFPEIYRMQSMCPCCEYDSRTQRHLGTNTNPCHYCPLKKLWPKGCLKENSPYKVWCRDYVPFDVHAQAARQIVAACDVLLAKYKPRKEESNESAFKEEGEI